MKNVYIYVDDIRTDDKYYRYLNSNIINGIDRVIICRSFSETINALEDNKFENIILDLDHDLGEGNENELEPSGYDICKYIVENQIPLMYFHIHSYNPVGAINMRQLLTHYGYKEIY